MRLIEDFFQIKEVADNRVTFTLNPNHTIYKAHFPGQPITPGVCILQIVTEVVEYLHNCRLQLKNIDDAKFISPLIPNEGEAYFVEIKNITDNGDLSIHAVVSGGSGVIAKLFLDYKKVQ